MMKRVGVLALALSAGMAVFQPVAAKAADWHDRDGRHHRREYRERDRHRDRDWRRNQWREHERWENRRNRGYLYFNFGTAPRYYYTPAAPSYSYPYGSYSYSQCPY